MADNKKFIDIDEVFRSKNPSLYRFLPRFFLSYLKRVIHQEDINRFIELNGYKKEFEFVDAVIDEFGAKVEYAGLEHIPQNGGFILASNHPLGGLDALSLVHVIAKRRKDIRFVVNDILMRLDNLKGLFAGVNKHGRNSADVFRELDNLYASGNGILIFPAGLVSRKQKGVIRDLVWKKSFITNSRRYNLPVIPVFIGGSNSNFFYNLSRWRTKLGINLNIEMLYLADEMYKQKNHTIPITIGTPIAPSVFDKSVTDIKWAALVKEHVYRLEKSGPFTTFDKEQQVYAANN